MYACTMKYSIQRKTFQGYTYTCIHTHIFIYIQIYTHTYTYTYRYIYIHIHIYTGIHPSTHKVWTLNSTSTLSPLNLARHQMAVWVSWLITRSSTEMWEKPGEKRGSLSTIILANQSLISLVMFGGFVEQCHVRRRSVQQGKDQTKVPPLII